MACSAFADQIIDNGASQTVTSGTPFDAAGYLVVGGNNLGQFYILSGGQATNTDAYIGLNPGSQGEVYLSGTGSMWMTNGYLTIGLEGQAFVNVDDGARAIVIDSTDLAAFAGSYAQLTLSGASGARGLFSTSYIMKGAGTGLLQWDGGILQARSNQTEFLPNFIFGDVAITGNGAFFDTNGFDVGMQTPGILIGSGGFTKLGAGTLSIAGGNSWDGDTTVTAGILTLDSYSQTGSQALTIGVAGSATYGRLQVAGTATFANTNLAVDVIGSPTLANNLTLTDVITAGTLTATSFVVTDNSALFDFAAIVDGNTVDLNVSTNAAGITVYSSTLNNRLFPALGAAAVLDTQVQGTPSGDMAAVVTALGTLSDERSLARAAAQTLPLNAGSDSTLATLGTINSIFAGRFALGDTDIVTPEASAAHKHLWVRPLGSRVVQNDTERNASGYSAGTWGVAAGIDGEIGETELGFGYAYANTHLSGHAELSGAGTHSDIDSHVIAAYGSHPIHDMSLGFQVDMGWNDNTSDRNLNFGGLNRVANASYDSWTLHAGASLSQAIALDPANTIIPSLRADYTRLRTQAYTESGAGALDLDVDASTVQAMVFGVDARLVHALSPKSRLEAVVGVSYDAINDDASLTAAYAGAPGTSFVADGIDHGPWLAKAGLAFTHGINDGLNVSLRYDAGWRDDYLSQSVSIKAAMTF